MKFYILGTDSVFSNYPKIKQWYGNIDIRYLNKEEAYKIPKRQLLSIYEKENTVFTSVINQPFPMVSEAVKEVFDMYEPHIKYKQIILLDSIYEKSCVYYIPILDEVDCLSESSLLNLDRSVIKHGVIDYSRTEEKAVFRLGNVNGYYIVCRLDVAESILKREVIGIGLMELEVINDRTVR